MGSNRVPFTPDEDLVLISLVPEYGTHRWAEVAEFFPNRTARQCRNRYNNYLDPERDLSPWTRDDDEKLKKLVYKFGPDWKAIAQLFPGRSYANVYNRFRVIHRGLERRKTVSTTQELPKSHLDINSLLHH